MELTESEIETAAHLLMERYMPDQHWSDADEDKKQVFRLIVIDLAKTLDVSHSPGAVKAFMTWMGAVYLVWPE